MLLNDMSVELRGMLEVFNIELRRAGWEVTDFSQMFNAGMSVNPEGMASFENERVTLEAHLCLPERELRLFILDREPDQLIRLVLEFKQDFRSILSCVIDEQDRLDKDTFPKFLQRSSRLAERIWFVDHEGARFLLEVPNNAPG